MERRFELLRPLDDIWAKSSRGTEAPETLLAHTHEVVRALAQIQRRWPHLAELCNSPRLWHRLFWACYIHDFGKAADPFQQMLRSKLLSFQQRHEIISLAFLPCVAERDDIGFAWIAAAIASHHKNATDILEDRYSLAGEREDLALDTLASYISDNVYTALGDWLREDAFAIAQDFGLHHVEPPWPGGAPASRRSAPDAIYAGLAAYDRLFRHLRRQPAGCKENQEAVILRGVMVLADHLASAHAPPLAQVAIPDVDELLRRTGAARTPRPHQTDAALSGGNILLTAPTGSGKTEAALLWGHARQRADGWLRPVLYLLPYQASLNAMYKRLKDVLSTDVALLHGRSTQVLNRQLLDEGRDPKSAQRAARRAADLARLHQPAVCVATPYQLLRAAYMLPGYESQWTTLSGAVLMVDEVHAYEPQRLGLFLGLIANLVREWDVRVCTLTATMPTWLRTLVTDATAATPIRASADIYENFRRHRLELLDEELNSPAVIGRIGAEARDGRSVLVVANTIREAQETWQQFRRLLPQTATLLLHSRFNGRDRSACEADIVDRLNAGAATSTPFVLVSTQAVEVSLDLDFDTIFTQPAPLEALAQRFGRVNRRGSKGIVPVRVLTQPQDGQGIYDPRLIDRALSVLKVRDGDVVDEARLSDWLDEVYGDELAREWTDKVRQSQHDFERMCLSKLRAFGGDENLADQFDQLFDGTEVLPAMLEPEYLRIAEGSVLSAQSLLVPVRWSAVQAHMSKVRWTSDKSVRVIDLPYDSKIGLHLGSIKVAE